MLIKRLEIVRKRGKNRPPTLLKPHLLPKRMRHNQDIGKEDRSIKIETLHRLQRHLDSKLRRKAEVQERAGLLRVSFDIPADSALPAA